MKSSIIKTSFAIFALALLILAFAVMIMPTNVAYAADGSETSEEAQDGGKDMKAIGAGIVVGLAAAAGAIGMGIAIAKSNESISRQPEAEGKIRSNMMLGLVFIETAIIYALIVAILIIFVL